jgi:hypothetical protein
MTRDASAQGFVVGTFCVLMMACATQDYIPPIDVRDAAAPDWVALASRWTGPDEHKTQLVTFVNLADGVEYHARYETGLSMRGTIMVALTPLGIPLYELVATDGRLDITRHADELDAVPVEKALADFVLAYWPLPQLAEVATASGHTVIETMDARQLLGPDGSVLVEVRRSTEHPSEVLEVTHHDVPLTLSIRTLSVDSGA